MTRVNVIDPTELADQHLMAEYRELLMVPASLRRSLRTQSIREVLAKIPPFYTLNKGHVTFFYNKLVYLRDRYELLRSHLAARGFSLDETRTFELGDLPPVFAGDWAVTPAAERIVRERIAERIASKPEWYRWTPYDKKFLHG